MKKIILPLITIIFFSCSHEKLTDKRNFSINNIEAIDYIEIKNKTPKEVILKKENEVWKLKNGFAVKKEAINYLLETLRDIEIKRPVAVNEKENILKRMSIQRTKVSLYSNEKKIKTIYVGGNTQDQLGTYMILEDSSEPYVVSIPGFNGYLSSRFSCEENDWKDKIIFNYDDNEIESVHLNYRDTIHSFKIYSDDSSSNKYFSNFKNISSEKFLKNNRDFNIEEIIKRNPIFDISLNLKNGKKIELIGFEKKSSLRGRTSIKDYDTERFYGLFNGELILIQYKQFKNIFTALGLDLSYDDLRTTSNASASLKKQEGDFVELSGKYGFTYDLRDRAFMPTSGSITKFNQTLPIAADKPFIGNTFSTSSYYTVNEDIVGATKLFLSAINGLDNQDVRISKRKFLSNKRLRGFEQGKIGPVDSDDHVGGNYAAALNLEANLPNLLPESSNTDISVFFDVGNVWGVDYDSSLDDSNKLRA